ncbi:YHS domain-containing (seleno)protein [Emticicia sp. BO119]|uniref:YHS domain-containing (seleno)protein n=1 Tax=Emticicia sp. BO119 TaxID=2757768 RepID=UPI0015EFEB94|nr:YHS domain-containing (seleno)protein [Emticicia sp. BO119]MBA4849267.1 YHS domain protein [Emticicia sp. BO119]
MKKLFFLLVMVSLQSLAQETAIRQKHFLLEKGIALSGYDPVSYFSNKPVKGKISYIFNGITYKFANEPNLEAFKKTPLQYEPAYGGWCAYAMGAKGEKVEVDPENYKIIDGKVYLFYKTIFNNTLNSWNEEEARLKKQADINWIKIYK